MFGTYAKQYGSTTFSLLDDNFYAACGRKENKLFRRTSRKRNCFFLRFAYCVNQCSWALPCVLLVVSQKEINASGDFRSECLSVWYTQKRTSRGDTIIARVCAFSLFSCRCSPQRERKVVSIRTQVDSNDGYNKLNPINSFFHEKKRDQYCRVKSLKLFFTLNDKNWNVWTRFDTFVQGNFCHPAKKTEKQPESRQ